MATAQALTAAGLAGASDLVAQRISGTAPINWRRTALMAVRFGYVPFRTSLSAVRASHDVTG